MGIWGKGLGGRGGRMGISRGGLGGRGGKMEQDEVDEEKVW